VPRAEQALAIAQQYLGTAYVWGGSTPATGFDSAGLTQYAYTQVGVALPRTTDGQFASGAAVSHESLRLGDLVFFRDASGYLFHVGLFAGDMRFLHAAHAGDVIKYSSLEEPYYGQQFAGARHIAD
jgi:cell wall-associated NlpC family hydrolase